MINLSTPSRLSYLDEDLRRKSISYHRKVTLDNITYMRTGGIAERIIHPHSATAFATTLKILTENAAPYKAIGSTSNLLFLDNVNYSNLVSTIGLDYIKVDRARRELVCGGGAMLPELARQALYNSIGGFEGLEGIPGTIGGAVFMNAGAYGSEIRDTLTTVKVAHADGLIRTYSVDQLGLVHRSSNFRAGKLTGIIVEASFKGIADKPENIYRKMEVYHAKRHKYQDFMYPNLGSIFSGSPYRALGYQDLTFRIISSVYYIVCYKWKLIGREAPINRRWLNDMVLRRFPLHFAVQPYSDKTLNCLVNRGQGTSEMVRFIDELQALTLSRIPLENEIVQPF